jgi:hypothetical protein
VTSAVQAPPAAQKVFICYRREETAAHAGRLYDAMVARFGERNVFMDVDIAPGVDFVERITEVVSSCLVLIVVMGPSWPTAEDEDGNPRVADPDDFVRLEVETGLRRSDVTVIPVLVAGARMPKREDLPAELQPITRRNAIELSDARWAYDVGRLNTTLDGLLGETSAVANEMNEASEAREAPAAVTEEQPRAAVSPGRLLLEGVALAGVTAFAARYLGEKVVSNWTNDDAGQIAAVILRRGLTLGLVGVALALWLGMRMRRADYFRPATIGLIAGALAGAIGGAIWAVPSLGDMPDLVKTDLPEARRIEIGALAVSGGILGALIGSLWRPPRLAVGLAAGIAAGVLFQLFVIATGLFSETDPPAKEVALAFGLGAATIAGIPIAALLANDRLRSPPALPPT